MRWSTASSPDSHGQGNLRRLDFQFCGHFSYRRHRGNARLLKISRWHGNISLLDFSVYAFCLNFSLYFSCIDCSADFDVELVIVCVDQVKRAKTTAFLPPQTLSG
ncbi:hypothetical protein [Rhodocyclus tenuis]|uniref:Uncharacterized protein n=1 Tax=Rhodocyclus tenuis TaxID=1066 RepID=A0A840G860_RHOTE|nr:hypothetical protein [Rhodocyclus tenuis]MBB4248523.1 hypothetical protein [Rhodocyclus tenuis]